MDIAKRQVGKKILEQLHSLTPHSETMETG